MIRTIATDAGANLALQAVSVVLGVVIGVTLSRLLGADGLGVYAFAMSLATLLATVARMGLTTLVVREVAVGKERGDWAEVVGLVSWAQWATASVSVGIGAIVVAIASLLAMPETFWTVCAAMLLLVAMSVTWVLGSALRGLNAVVVANIPFQIVRPGLALVGIGVLSWTSLDRPQLAMGVEAGAWFVAGLVAWWFWRGRVPVAPPTQAYSPRKWLTAALPLLVLDGLLMTMHQSDVLMLKWMSTDASTGIYSIVAQLGRFTALILVVANSVISPRFAALHEAGQRQDLQNLVRLSARAVTVLTAVVAAGLLGFGEAFLTFYSPGFEVGYTALVVLVAGQAINAMAGSVGYLMIMTGHDRDVAWVSAGVALLNVALNIALIPAFDMLGAALASAVSVSVWNVTLAALVRYRLGLNSTAF